MARIMTTFFALSLLFAHSTHATVQTIAQESPIEENKTIVAEQNDEQADEQNDNQLIDDQKAAPEKSQSEFTQVLESLAQQLESHDPIDVLVQFNAKKEALATRYEAPEVAYLASIINLAIDSELLAMQRNAFQYAAENNLKKARLITAALETVAKRLESIDAVRAAYAKSINQNIEAAIALNA